MTNLFASLATLLDRGARNEDVSIASPRTGAVKTSHGDSHGEDPATGAGRPVRFERGRAY